MGAGCTSVLALLDGSAGNGISSSQQHQWEQHIGVLAITVAGTMLPQGIEVLSSLTHLASYRDGGAGTVPRHLGQVSSRIECFTTCASPLQAGADLLCDCLSNSRFI